MTIETITPEHLDTVAGGQQAAPQPQPSVEERAREIAREEIDLEMRSRDHEQFREWEKRHPFSAMVCQGDQDCSAYRR